MFNKKKNIVPPETSHNKLTPEDILEVLPVPPKGTMWKIVTGTRYVSTAYIDPEKNETFPFVLELIKDDTSAKDQLVAKIGIRILRKDHINGLALKLLAYVVKNMPEYTMIQPATGEIAENLNIVGYYAPDRSKLAN
jgi:hypothetical protein